MRRALFFLPLVLVGCKPGRQTSVSSTGGLASTIESGTFVVGQGKVAEGGSDVAWSPDGSSLAIAAKDGALIWPKESRLPKMQGPLSWSPFGDFLAGSINDKAVVWDLATNAANDTTIKGRLSRLFWTPDGHLIGVNDREIQVDGGPSLEVQEGQCADAVALADGAVAFLTWKASLPKLRDLLATPVHLKVWIPEKGSTSAVPIGAAGELFGVASPNRLSIPMRFALAPDGRRIAVAGMRLEANARTISRLLEIADQGKTTPAQRKESEALLKSARFAIVVALATPDGRRQTLWSMPSDDMMNWPSDLKWSPDGKWLAIARTDGTIRIAVE